jgi:hypothetical protein
MTAAGLYVAGLWVARLQEWCLHATCYDHGSLWAAFALALQ